jgi:hypothetical protein
VDAWAVEGIRRGTDLTSGAPGAGHDNTPGGFDAVYDPAAGELVIIMRCAVEFTDGISRAGVADGGCRPSSPDERLARAVTPSPARRRQRPSSRGPSASSLLKDGEIVARDGRIV